MATFGSLAKGVCDGQTAFIKLAAQCDTPDVRVRGTRRAARRSPAGRGHRATGRVGAYPRRRQRLRIELRDKGGGALTSGRSISRCAWKPRSFRRTTTSCRLRATVIAHRRVRDSRPRPAQRRARSAAQQPAASRPRARGRLQGARGAPSRPPPAQAGRPVMSSGHVVAGSA